MDDCFNCLPMPRINELLQEVIDKLVLWFYKEFDTAGDLFADFLCAYKDSAASKSQRQILLL